MGLFSNSPQIVAKNKKHSPSPRKTPHKPIPSAIPPGVWTPWSPPRNPPAPAAPPDTSRPWVACAGASRPERSGGWSSLGGSPVALSLLKTKTGGWSPKKQISWVSEALFLKLEKKDSSRGGLVFSSRRAPVLGRVWPTGPCRVRPDFKRPPN